MNLKKNSRVKQISTERYGILTEDITTTSATANVLFDDSCCTITNLIDISDIEETSLSLKSWWKDLLKL